MRRIEQLFRAGCSPPDAHKCIAYEMRSCLVDRANSPSTTGSGSAPPSTDVYSNSIQIRIWRTRDVEKKCWAMGDRKDMSGGFRGGNGLRNQNGGRVKLFPLHLYSLIRSSTHPIAKLGHPIDRNKHPSVCRIRTLYSFSRSTLRFGEPWSVCTSS